MESRTLIKTEKLSFMDMIYYPDISILQGQTTFIKGESGSGKSTLLKLFSSLVSAGSGKIYYDGDDIDSIDPLSLRRDITYVPQTFWLFDGTVKDNFREFYRYKKIELIDDDQIRKYLNICMIDRDLNSDTVSMSGGERQRVFMALCLSFLPKIIMLDEPTSALDGPNAYKMLLNIEKFCNKNGMTMLIVSHDDKLSSDFAKQIITLRGRSAQ